MEYLIIGWKKTKVSTGRPVAGGGAKAIVPKPRGSRET